MSVGDPKRSSAAASSSTDHDETVAPRECQHEYWPSRTYNCSFCPRMFRTAQALGGHMNVHRRERAHANEMVARHPEIVMPHSVLCPVLRSQVLSQGSREAGGQAPVPFNELTTSEGRCSSCAQLCGFFSSPGTPLQRSRSFGSLPVQQNHVTTTHRRAFASQRPVERFLSSSPLPRTGRDPAQAPAPAPPRPSIGGVSGQYEPRPSSLALVSCYDINPEVLSDFMSRGALQTSGDKEKLDLELRL